MNGKIGLLSMDNETGTGTVSFHGASEWVPLLKVSWSWGGSGHWDGQQWTLMQGSAVNPNPQKQETTDYPEWANISKPTLANYKVE
jgi:hypothetical protein